MAVSSGGRSDHLPLPLTRATSPSGRSGHFPGALHGVRSALRFRFRIVSAWE